MKICRLMIPIVFIAVGLVPAAIAVAQQKGRSATTVASKVRVVKTYRHDGKAFTQGLVIKDGIFVEGTGQRGESQLREVDLKTGRVLRHVKLPDSVFGEGVTVLHGRVYQLTWEKGYCYVYDRKTMQYKETLRYRGEGWGLTHDGHDLIMSDGSPVIRFRDPKSLNVKRTLRVRDGRKSLKDINELEYYKGDLLANVWYDYRIARIDLKSGQVKQWYDLSRLKPREVLHDREAVLNGIAWDQKADRLFVTGKDWPALYEIDLGDKKDPVLKQAGKK